MNTHCVFYRTNIIFDGRVSSIIKTLAESFPNDNINIFEYPIKREHYKLFPSNVHIIKPKYYFNNFKKTSFVTLLLNFEYALRGLVFLIKTRPKSIQVHHEIVTIAPLIYKLFNRKTVIVYDDKEMYHPRDSNIPSILFNIEYKLIELSELVIITNKYREKALKFIHKNKIKNHIIVDNYVFEPDKKIIDPVVQNALIQLISKNQKILLHVGVLSENRGIDLIKFIAQSLPKDWALCFIGIDDKMYNDFKNSLDDINHDKLHNLGFINYDELNSIYDYINACVIFYDSKTFNNKYCSPNRLYSAVNNGVPIIVNNDNATLSEFVSKYKNGFYFEAESNLSKFFDNFEQLYKNAQLLKNKYEFSSIIPQLKDFYIHL